MEPMLLTRGHYRICTREKTCQSHHIIGKASEFSKQLCVATVDPSLTCYIFYLHSY